MGKRTSPLFIGVFGADIVDRQIEGAIERSPTGMFALEGHGIGFYSVLHAGLDTKLLDILVEGQSFVFVKSYGMGSEQVGVDEQGLAVDCVYRSGLIDPGAMIKQSTVMPLKDLPDQLLFTIL